MSKITVAEEHPCSRLVWRLVDAHQKWWFPIVLCAWSLISKILGRWSVDWRLIVTRLANLPDLSCISPSVWSALGPAPIEMDRHPVWRYRMPLWWTVSACRSRDFFERLSTSINFQERLSNGACFLYAALSARNDVAVAWALENGVSVHTLCPNFDPLLCFAMDQEDPDQAKLVPLLLDHGADWHFVSPNGRSAAQLSQLRPQWHAWFEKRLLLLNLDLPQDQAGLPEKKARRM